MFTPADFDRMARNDAWLGFGYLGERRNQLAEGRTAEVAEADAVALAEANVMGLSEDQLFEWANSKQGRWFGDCMFGNAGRHHVSYLPGQIVR